MSVVIYTDPHIGVYRVTNTTPRSRKALQDRCVETVRRIHSRAVSKHDCAPAVCLGDLFDKYDNPAQVTLSAATIFRQLRMCLAGNHDISNDATKRGSLELLHRLTDHFDGYESCAILAPFGTKDPAQLVHSRDLGKHRFFAIPHVANNEIFENALHHAWKVGRESKGGEHPGGKTVLLLHCNYNNDFCNETELNISEYMAESLLEVFDYVLLGHEHPHREAFGGRLVCLGNTFPTSFSDIGDKFYWTLEDDGELVGWKIWEASELHWRGDWRMAEDLSDEMIERVQFIELTGEATIADTKELSVLTRRLWRYCPDLLALRSKVEVQGLTTAFSSEQLLGSVKSLPEKISDSLADSPELSAYWDVVQGALESGNSDKLREYFDK